mgnify:CR=1 FL=1
MWNSENTFDAELDYAVRMVTMGYATVEQAAASCGLQPDALRAHLVAQSSPATQESEKDRFFAKLVR